MFSRFRFELCGSSSSPWATCCLFGLILLLLPFAAAPAAAQVDEASWRSVADGARDPGAQRLPLQGMPVTGWNKRFGDPVAHLRFVDQLSFSVAGVFNPDGPALEVNGSTSPDDLLASYAAPEVYLAFFGVPNAETAPNQNILYADYPQLITHDSQQGPLPQHLEIPQWWGKSNGAQVRDLTVRRWLEARGRLTFACSPNGESYYTLEARNLIPGGLYTVWGFYFDQDTGQLQPDFALGGTSANVFAADKDGRIRSSKALSVCIPTLDPGERFQPVNFFLVFHPDGRVNAAVGHTVATPPFNGPGMTATPQLMFPMPNR